MTAPLVCNRDAAVPYEQADTATCPHCGHTAREHWTARTEENVAQWERQAALSDARDEVVRAAVALAPEILPARDGDGWLIGQYAYGDVSSFMEAVAAYEKLAGGA